MFHASKGFDKYTFSERNVGVPACLYSVCMYKSVGEGMTRTQLSFKSLQTSKGLDCKAFE